jgi:hypothetical protein
VASGYAEALGIPRKAGTMPIWPALVAVGMLLLWFVVADRARRGAWTLFPAGALAFVMFVLVKASYVRHDPGHVLTAPLTLLAIAVAMAAIPAFTGEPSLRVLGTASVAACLLASSWASALGWNASLPGAVAGRAIAAVKGLRDEMSGRHAIEHANKLAFIRATIPLGGLNGPVDAYPLLQGAVLANRLPYAPRPVIQSSSAYRPELLRINARHLESDDAANTLLVDFEPLDSRYPAFDDSLSLLPMLSRYNPAGMSPAGLVLVRSGQPRRVRFKAITAIEARIGEPLHLPRRLGLVWATVDVRPTLRGRLRGLLLKPSPLLIATQTRKHGVTPFRMIPSIARAGFLLSPLIASRTDLADVLRGAPVDGSETVAAMVIMPVDGELSGADWEIGYTITLWQIVVE